MNNEQLEYLLAIVKYESFTKAANGMFISQSSLSKKIKSLERELGVEILDRSKGQIRLTHAGKEVYKFAQIVLHKYNNLNKTLEQFRLVSETDIRFASIPILSYYGTTELLAEFSNINKDKQIYFNIIEMNQEFVLQALNNNEVDIALIRDDFISSYPDCDILNYYLDDFVLVCHKDHPLASKNLGTFNDMSKYFFILMDRTSRLSSIILNEFKTRNLEVKIKNIVSRHNLILEMVSKDLGISILPRKLLETSQIENLVYLPIEISIKSKLVLVKKKKQKHNSITNAFWNYCKDCIDY